MKSYFNQCSIAKAIKIVLLLVLVNIVKLYYDSYTAQTLVHRREGGSNPMMISISSRQEHQQNVLDPNAVHHTTVNTLFKSMYDIANQTNQVFITMPAKAAGTTMKRFAEECSAQKMPDNFMNYQHKIQKVFIDNYDSPSVIASHLRTEMPFINIVKGSTRETLIIHIHREELSRVRSAIQYVLRVHICSKSPNRVKDKYHFGVEKINDRCIINEENLISLIENRADEIGLGAPKILTCNFFNAIEKNVPSNLVFLHYKQVPKLQKILAKYYCPNILKNVPISENIAKKGAFFVRLKTDSSREVSFNEWFDKKQNIILWALNLNKKMDCKSKIMEMEDHLFSCPDEAVTFFHGEFQCVSLSKEEQ